MSWFVLHSRFRFSIAVLVALAAAIPVASVSADERTGEQIYRATCAKCHGADGQGVADEYEEPLVGDRSLEALTKLVVETMPEGRPELCVGEDAAKVARFVFDTFYSEVAQARNRPARIEFARLTNRQYERAVADLLGTFLGEPRSGEERGLTGEYFADRSPRRDKRKIERRDATVDFDFAAGTPAEEGFDPKEFSAAWNGSLVPPETGEYEFVVATENGMKLWVGDGETPLIDAWVKSPGQTEYRRAIRLLGGRAVPLRLEFFTYQEPTASIRLQWRPPHGVLEVVPERVLRTDRVPETYVVGTGFPPDDRSTGYERGTSISKAWDEATTRAALDVGRFVVRKLDRLAQTRWDAPDRADRVREFCRRFVERAFRRPLSDEERTFFVERWFEPPGPDEPALAVESAVQRVVLLALKSPRFLYRESPGGRTFDAYDTAAWLSFGLWDSLPDQNLLNAAAQGRLQTAAQIGEMADRMSRDPRATEKLRTFLDRWLQLDHIGELAKDETAFPGFDARTAADLRTSLDLLLEDRLAAERFDFRDLLTSETLYLNGRLAKWYGADLPEDAGFQQVKLDGQPRAGVLSHPYLMAGFAYDATTSPIHRGVFLARRMLGRRLRPPPEAFSPLAPDLHPQLSTRERVALQTSPATCQTCHAMINPLGFPLERFDAIGRYRTEERGRPIDATGSYDPRSAERVEFEGVRELADFLVRSDEVHEAFAEQLFQYATKQPAQAFGDDQLGELRTRFVELEFDVRRLFAESVARSAIVARERGLE